jgi:hypothetical protein
MQKQQFIFGKNSLSFHRNFNPQTDLDPADPKRRIGMIYIHHWGTGWQQLIMDDEAHAERWWNAELKRLKEKVKEVLL